VLVDDERDDPASELSVEKTELDVLRSYAEEARVLQSPSFSRVGGAYERPFEEWIGRALGALVVSSDGAALCTGDALAARDAAPSTGGAPGPETKAC
jgi:hypothetical protein